MTVDRDIACRALPGYELGDEIGRGGWAVVWDARHRLLGHEVAVKQLRRELAADSIARSQSRNEARLLASLSHPHIVRFFDYVEHDGIPLLVTERLRGGDVWLRFTTVGWNAVGACAVAMAALAGLHHAHQRGFVHGDVTPSNLMFDEDGVLKLTDFALAAAVGDTAEMIFPTGPVGTPPYIAPEQCQGLELTAATDVYGVGMVVYELLTGRLPFDLVGGTTEILEQRVREDPRPIGDVETQVPDTLARVVMRALNRDPDRRFATAEQCASAIGEAATSAWGRAWFDDAHLPLFAGRRVMASTLRLTGPGANTR